MRNPIFTIISVFKWLIASVSGLFNLKASAVYAKSRRQDINKYMFRRFLARRRLS